MSTPARWWRVLTLAGVPIGVWALGLLGACLVMGPALGPGSLLNLDLVLVPDPPVPRGVWALGPELPRRVPMWVPIAWLSSVLGGDLVGKTVMVLGMAVAFAGMYRLVQRILTLLPVEEGMSARLAAIGAAILYAFGPFLVTRLAVGHLNIVWTMALLPWALPDLLVPDRSVRRVFLWCAAIGFTGSYGGTLVGVVLIVALAARRGRRAPAVLAALVFAQLPWLLPLVIVSANGTAMVDAASFPSSGSGLAGIGQMLAGHGFWNFPLQIGWPGGWLVATLGFALLGLAVMGAGDLPPAWRVPLTTLAALGLLAAASSGVPGVTTAVVRLSQTPIGAPFRETQRLLPLFLLWLTPACVLGALRLAGAMREQSRRLGLAVAAVPIVMGLVLAAPGRWGAGGQLQPVQFPAEWAEARDRVRHEPGSLVAFPWYQYFSFNVADNRLVLNTVPLYFGGDVLASSDPNISGGVPSRERGDPREARVRLLSGQVQVGRSISRDLVDLGVRWLVLLKDVDWTKYEPGLNGDPGLERVIDGPDLALYRVRDWAGKVIDEQGRAVASSEVVSPLELVDASGPARAAIPGTAGWMRGLSGATPAADGLLALPSGSGWLWYWPAVLVILGDVAWLVAVALTASAIHARGPQVRPRSPQNRGQSEDPVDPALDRADPPHVSGA